MWCSSSSRSLFCGALPLSPAENEVCLHISVEPVIFHRSRWDAEQPVIKNKKKMLEKNKSDVLPQRQKDDSRYKYKPASQHNDCHFCWNHRWVCGVQPLACLWFHFKAPTLHIQYVQMDKRQNAEVGVADTNLEEAPVPFVTSRGTFSWVMELEIIMYNPNIALIIILSLTGIVHHYVKDTLPFLFSSCL